MSDARRLLIVEYLINFAFLSTPFLIYVSATPLCRSALSWNVFSNCICHKKERKSMFSSSKNWVYIYYLFFIIISLPIVEVVTFPLVHIADSNLGSSYCDPAIICKFSVWSISFNVMLLQVMGCTIAWLRHVVWS